MNAVKEGQLYFLKSPFTSTVSMTHEKTLAYALGTVSSRPAVVIRRPYFWDNYSTVTVIPCLTNGHPGIPLKLIDRYGYLTEAEYTFMPHTPHSIPVGRLGRFIGVLTNEELDEIMEAFEWIHNPSKQKVNQIPACYRAVMAKPKPKSWMSMKDNRANINLSIDRNMVFHSDTNPELDDVTVDIDLPSSVTPTIKKEIENDPDYHCTDSPLPDISTLVTEGYTNRVPAERDFPDSMFRKEDLYRVAARFTIDESYYRDTIKARNPDVINQEELEAIQTRGITDSNIAYALETYKKMKPIDAYMFGPRLPLDVLKDLLECSFMDAVALKRVCNIMRDMTNLDYDRRIALLPTKKEGIINELPVEKPVVPQPVKQPIIESPKKMRNPIVNKEEQKDVLKKLKPYMTETKIFLIPPHLVSDFLRLPEHVVRNVYSGRSFKVVYKRAYTKYMSAVTE